MSVKIFYVEDDETLSFITEDQLQEAGYEVSHFADGAAAVAAFEKGKFDIAILDVMLPSIDGFGIAEKIREQCQEIPILFLSAKSLEEDRLHGLTIGGDDYLTKPFSMDELLLKIKIFLKRNKIHVHQGNVTLSIGNFTLNTDDFLLKSADFSKELTQKEAALMQMFVEYKNETIKREDILIRLWGKNDYFLGRSLDVFISRLRKYLASDESIKINTVRGVGFRLEELKS